MGNARESELQIKDAVLRVSRIVSETTGIQLGERQFQMVKSRLSGHMVRLKIHRFKDYLDHLNENLESESQALVSLLTTHHTFFFREFSHFEYLLNHGLERMIQTARKRGDKKIRIWSAACSQGQEAYSLAMFFHFHLQASAPDVDFEIWGTDVDPQSVKWAKNAVYKAEELKQSPAMYVSNHWVRGKDEVKDFSKLKASLKNKCHFQVENLLNCDQFLKDKKFDVIFCRNVFIYFDNQQIKKSSEKMLKHLETTGFLVLGVSESLNGMNLSVNLTGPSIYEHPQAKKIAPPSNVVALQKPKIYRVLCVDDSPVILALLKRMLDEKSGFQVVATAPNGVEAIKVLKTTAVDAITLDLHMPEMDGIGFLQTYTDRQVPIMVVSSVNRDDKSLAQKALSLGASDYVEKPSLENIEEAKNQLTSKLKTVLLLSMGKRSGSPQQTPAIKTSEVQLPIKKKVLIVDDSATIRDLLEKIISADPGLQVVGKAEKPSQVEDMIRKTAPDLITLDIHMPEMDGVTLLKKIQPKFGIPTVMISSISMTEGPLIMQALEIGAIDYIQKPEMANLATLAPQIRERLKAAIGAGVKPKVMARKARKTFSATSLKSMILLGASTGGTEAIKVVLESLPKEIPPILIAQHIPAGFSGAFARRLNELFPFEVREAQDGDEVLPNLVLVAPGGKQMTLHPQKDKLIIRILPADSSQRHNPSVDVLFRSAAKHFPPSKIAAVLMTGMGNDGAAAMKELKNSGARTIAQNKESCVVFGMPREAIERGGAEFICPLSEIGQQVLDCLEKSGEVARPEASKKLASG